ncbi:DUF2254 domain-containing protein [Primorskyibacter aestuariivivens]|uniref:DUF2254 domain-containing protein n=1 Tax=Primorskyibacter aestuariivivens TaxID=1888912 RepID=UPI002300400F|nr:DUF2254 domain-containing protein [Primorskyibacter aestuariivivens]MDA7428148.1 DUF2254 domain-containing protein [Primorskyibacter aestuariivivens]
MISRWVVLLRRWSRILWVRVALISLGSLLALAVAPLLSFIVPEEMQYRFGREAILPVLTILASGMLAVTTFSLNVMVSAYRTASSTATPRVYRLLLEDTVTQSVLATFVGGFVFSLIAVILFHAELYTPQAAVAVFVITLVVVALIVIAILRWIDHLSSLGSMDHTLRLIEARTRAVLKERASLPCLGGGCVSDDSVMPADVGEVLARKSGFIRFIDMARLNEKAAREEALVYVTRSPGEYVLRGQPLAQSTSRDEEFCASAARCFEIGDVRSFDQDASFGLTLLAETAQRALSPGVNDPGTAIEVIGRLERLLWEDVPDGFDRVDDADARFTRVFLAPDTAGTLLERALVPIARDGADDPDVMGRLNAALGNLCEHPSDSMSDAARRQIEACQPNAG